MAEVSESEAVTCERATPKWVFGSNGKLREVPPNTIARQWNPETGEPEGVLIEESRTNLLLWSEDFTNAEWSKSRATVSANVVTAPDGSVTADKLVEDTSDNIHLIRSSTTEATAGDWLVFSFYVKSTERNAAASVAGIGFNIASFDLTDLSVISNIGVDITHIVDVGNGWRRIVVAKQAENDSSTCRGTVEVYNGGRTYTGDGTSGIYIWGAQLEEGSTPSSYIPTTDSPVTRAADNVSRVLGEEFNASEGTVVIRGFDAETTADVTGRGVLAIGNQFTPSIIIRRNSNGQHLFEIRGSSGSIATQLALGDPGARNLLISWDSENMIAAADGESVSVPLSGELANLSGQTLFIGDHPGAGNIEKHVCSLESVSYLPYAYSISEAQEATS